MTRALNRLDARLLRLQRPDRPWSISLAAHTDRSLGAEEIAAGLRRLAEQGRGWELRLAGDDPRRLRWDPAPDTTVALASGPATALLDRPFEMRREPPVRVGYDADADGGVVRLVVNHAFCDGRGALLLLRDLLAAAKGSVGDRVPAVSDADLDRLPPGGWAARVRVVGATARHAVRRVARLGTSGAAPTALASAAIEASSVIEGWRPHGLSVNDACVVAVHGAVRRATGDRRPVAVGVPIDLRPRFDGPASLGNAVLNATTLSSGSDEGARGAEAERHGAGVRAQATPERLGAQLAVYTRLARPGERPARPSRLSIGWPETAVCSNLGVVDPDPAWAGVQQIDFAPPAHEVASIGIVTLDGVMSITVRLRGPEDLAGAILDNVAGIAIDPDYS